VNFISFDFNVGVSNAVATVGYFLREQWRVDALRSWKLIRSNQCHNENLE
jgi:hypothetical protein